MTFQALYDTIGRGYTDLRRPDPRIAAVIDSALGDAETVANIGAGAGSYETDRTVIAVEPSEVMIRQRPAGAAPCLQGVAEALPLESKSIDAATAILTLHHWPDLERGLTEMARVARKRVVILTWVPDGPPVWLTEDYIPENTPIDRELFPETAVLRALVERTIGRTEITPLPIPHDCTDGFLYAYWRRPEAYLDPLTRNAISSFAKFNAEQGLAKLSADLSSGLWAELYGHLLTLKSIDAGYRIVTCEIEDDAAH